MGVLAADDFNRADASDLGANWTDVAFGPWSILSNQVATQYAYGNYYAQTYTGVSCPTDHYSKAAVVNLPTYTGGPVCRMTDYLNYYCFGVDPNDFGGATTYRLWKVVAGTATSLGTGTGTAAGGDTWQVQAQGTTIKGFANGSEKVSVTDSGLSSGAFGLFAFELAASLARFDDWEGGDFAAAAASIPPFRNQARRIARLMHF